MNRSPLRADTEKVLRHGRAHFRDFRSPKPHLFDKGYWAVGAIQIKLRPRSITLDGVDVRRRVIVGIDGHADVSKRENCGHMQLCQ
jgi:hypothetical protein